ncbi:hypothetical protein [Hymenobacter fodinae]|uniref:Uncharacterized protein n=1 Tax=Hymenobacter fodinae TaxID=2510796 RepID=A0A4Z0NZ87_9BACT|nr:hypothetical protein [Hymenobacter fodinae]TGE03729.1 hypothetical protein EU556_24260 [Hymenobacter fodinae]
MATTTPANQTAVYRTLVNKETYRAEEKEQLAELYVYTKYALINEPIRAKQQLDITPDLEYLIQHNLVKYIFNRSYVDNMRTKLLITGTVQNYYFRGSDFIRFMKDEVAASDGHDNLKVFFEKYDAWPYMLVVDQKLYHQLHPVLVEKFKKKVVEVEEL